MLPGIYSRGEIDNQRLFQRNICRSYSVLPCKVSLIQPAAYKFEGKVYVQKCLFERPFSSSKNCSYPDTLPQAIRREKL